MPGTRRPTLATRVVGRTFLGLEHVAGGLGTAVLAFLALVWLLAAAVLSVVGAGLLVLPLALASVRGAANRERARLSRLGHAEPPLGPLPGRLRDAVRDPGLRREAGWLVVHATVGLVLGVVGISLPLYAVRELSFPLWWYLLPDGQATDQLTLFTVHTWSGALLLGGCLGLFWSAATFTLVPGLAWLQGLAGRRLLRPPPGVDLSLRVAELTATRAAALDAHAAELRRIERSLHDGTQNRLVAVTVLLGAARRAASRDPEGADDLLERAQGAAEEALAELRAVARGILPPVLTDRGLSGALQGLVATSPVPATLDVQVGGRCPASVEATTYFVVAEALTNAGRHGGAGSVAVSVRRRQDRLCVQVSDDGTGGADEARGSGLRGIRSRVEAHDGAFAVSSPPGGPTRIQVELPCGS